MRIVAWNIRAGGGRRVDGIAAQIARWDADVAVLGEFRATSPSARLAALLAEQGLACQVTTARPALPAANALLVASRRPVRLLRSRAAPLEPGRWLLAALEATPGDRPIALGAMHVPNRVTGRKGAYLAAALEVARRWWRGPALLVGDTNSGLIGIDEERPAFNRMEDGWLRDLAAAGWSDAYRQLHGDTPAYTWYSPNGGNGFRLDQAFVNRALLPRLRAARYEWGALDGTTAYEARRDALSDHAALIVDLEG